MDEKAIYTPFFGRIVAVAYVYDTLFSGRIYKNPWEDKKYLRESRNVQEHALGKI